VLVTHDRYMLDRVSNIVLGLTAKAMRKASRPMRNGSPGRGTQAAVNASGGRRACSGFHHFPLQAKKKLSYLEAREYAGIEQRIADAEQCCKASGRAGKSAIASDGPSWWRPR